MTSASHYVVHIPAWSFFVSYASANVLIRTFVQFGTFLPLLAWPTLRLAFCLGTTADNVDYNGFIVVISG